MSFQHVELKDVLLHKLPAKRIQLADGSESLVTSVYDLMLANYGIDRGLVMKTVRLITMI